MGKDWIKYEIKKNVLRFYLSLKNTQKYKIEIFKLILHQVFVN